ncbi:MAG: pilus assembly protein PilP [Gammaproteobacteria bacterium]|nr:pilus assembly protein PilP [Gammaproteobacteria bacterium]
MNKINLKLSLTLLALSASLMLAGCVNQDMGDLNRYANEVKSRQAGTIEPLPEIKQVETFTYIPGDRRSPFRPSSEQQIGQEVVAANGIAPEQNRRKEELEGFELDSLRMVGSLEQDALIWALVQTKDSTIYRVKAGNYMGLNHGQINRITENSIDLTEIIPDGPEGHYRERQASVAMNQ